MLSRIGRAAGLGRGFAALGTRNFRLYWIGQGISRIGTWMQQISLPWLVLELGGSPIQLGSSRRSSSFPRWSLAWQWRRAGQQGRLGVTRIGESVERDELPDPAENVSARESGPAVR